MTTAAQDITEINKLDTEADNASFSSKLNSALDLNELALKTNTHSGSHYYYSAGSFNFLLEDGLKAETLEHTKINKVPYLQNWNMGIISIRGIIMPVIDIFGFIQSQSKLTERASSGKSYLLKLEHKDHSPIIFNVDNLPKQINIKKFKKTKADNNSPNWIQHYFQQGSTKVAVVNHKELLGQIIKSQ